MFEKTIQDLSIDFVLKLFGTLDGNIENIENAFSVSVVAREGVIKISGESASDVNLAASCIEQLERVSKNSESIDENTINYVITMVREEKENEEVAYGYEFRDHSSQKERAIIRDRDTYESYEVTYKTPGYQENLGLHKYHKYTQVFRCKCCGYEKREAARDVTKV